MYTIIKFDSDTRDEILKGINILADAVKTTMGPMGKNVIIEQKNSHPVITKDGVTVAKSINIRSQFKNLGVQMIKEAASRTADVAGDGTTTATVLTQAIYAEGLKMLASGYTSADIRLGINYAVDLVIKELRAMSIPITKDEEIRQIATISANGESQIGDLIFKAIKTVGLDGTITVEDAKGFKSSLNILEGMQIERGYLSPYFVNDQEKMTCTMDNPYILLCNKKIDSLKDITPILEEALNTQQPVLIIADDVDGDALQGLVVNRLKANLKVCSIKSPGFGESRLAYLSDLSTLLGCEIYSSESISKLSLDDLGRCKKLIVGRSSSVFVGGSGNKKLINEKIESIRREMKNISLSDDDIGFLKNRLSKLSGGVAVLRVGGATESELIERRDRVDDALHATQAAIAEGILPGGGAALVKASSVLLDYVNSDSDYISTGCRIVRNACRSPMRQIVENAGDTPELVLEKISNMEKTDGYDVRAKKYGNMFDMGIIDPLKVVRSALEYSSSAATMMLTAGCAIVEDTD